MNTKLKKNLKLKITIGWLYPELMSTYGDRGNIIVLSKRCEWRNISVEIKKLEPGFKTEDLKNCDLLLMGGAQDKQQKIVSEDLKQKRDILYDMIENGVPGLYVCGAYQFLGKYYKEADGTIINGLGIFDIHTENPGGSSPRLIGNIITSLCHPELISGSRPKRDSDLRQNDSEIMLVGFENHGGRTYLGKTIQPLNNVTIGYGNNGIDKTEGAIYKNSFGTYLHGPILPKNPEFADLLIKLALKKKYKKDIDLSLLDDSLEWQAHEAIIQRLG